MGRELRQRLFGHGIVNVHNDIAIALADRAKVGEECRGVRGGSMTLACRAVTEFLTHAVRHTGPAIGQKMWRRARNLKQPSRRLRYRNRLTSFSWTPLDIDGTTNGLKGALRH
jgi:hypothetical protein